MASDSVVYLAKAAGLRPPPGFHHYPPGYSELLRAAMHVGLGSARGFVAVNLLLLAVALGAVYRLCRQPMGLTPTKATVVCLVVLLSHTVSEVTPLVLSDVFDLAVTMICLLALSTAELQTGWPRRGWLALAAVLAAAAISIRSQSLALIPPLALVIVGTPNLSKLWHSASRHRPTAIPVAAVSLVAVVLAAVLVIGASPYGSQISHAWSGHGGVGGTLTRAGSKVESRLISVGELAAQTNCCQRLSHAFGLAVRPAFRLALMIGGAAVVALLVIGWRTRRRFGAIELYVLCTAAVVLVYGTLTRYWITALPFMVVYGFFAAERLARIKPIKGAAIVFGVAFAIAGGAWLVEEVVISTSGRRFPDWEKAIEPSLAPAYRVAFGEARPGDDRKVNAVALELLRRYEPLARLK